ncbi:hypothetical protein An02g03130 [Aspergillus niger]|uniref:Thioesterase domain-containing protein n=2 Tax=Aspergillus niger TaxID=5061 RepID=A2QCC9_ASPNC|nr:hypothetical protein An02g03130 [Aspergillus niger]CAK47593.1 hypothetical protein An02g03130 [Aspergillus niger]
MAPTTPLRPSKMPAPSVRPLSQLTPFEQLVHSYSTGPPTLNKNEEARTIHHYLCPPSPIRKQHANHPHRPGTSSRTNATSGSSPPLRIPRPASRIFSKTCMAALSKPGLYSYGGVSRNLKTTYIRPVPAGTEIRVVCELVHMGKRMALLRAEIQKLDGSVCVVAEHDKANSDPADIKI